VRDGYNCCSLGLHDEEDAEWEPVNNGSATLSEDHRKALRSILDSLKRRAKFRETFRPEAFPFPVVPRGRVEYVELCLGPHMEARHLLACAKTLLDSINDLSPGLGFIGSPAMRRKPLLQEGLLPLLQRHLVDSRRDAIPQ